MTDTSKPKTIDEYIATFPQSTQVVLQDLRDAIKKAAPEAQETISYGIPALTINGKYAVYFAGYAQHVSLHPVPSDESLQTLIQPYQTGKGTLHFALDKPLPHDIITKVVQALVKENSIRTAQ